MSVTPETLPPDLSHIEMAPPFQQSLTRVLLRNIFSNWVGFAVQIVVTFLLTPYVLNAIGQELYGVWSIVIGVTGYYGLLDLGLRAGLNQSLTRDLASRDLDALNRTASTGFFILLGFGGAVLVAGLGVSFWLPTLFHLPEGAHAPARLAVAVISVGVAAQFALFTFSVLLTADQRFDIANAIGVVTRVATAAATLIVLHFGGRLVALSCVAAASIVVDYAVRGAAAFRLVPTLRIRLRYAAGGRARALITYGLWSAVIQTGVSVISYTDAVVIGIFMTAAAITPFAFAVSLINYFSEVLVPIAQVFFPVFTKFDALSDAESIKRVYLQASRLMLLLSVSAGLVAWWCAPSFLALWIGPSILSENPWGSAATLFRILVVGAVAIAWQRIGCQVLMGTRRVRLQATLFMAEAACNLGLSVALIQPWGLTGVALGTTVPALIFNVGMHPYFTCQALKLPLRRYLATVLPRPCLAALVSGSVLFWFGHNLPSAVTWLDLVSRATGAVALVLGVSLAVGMRSDERENIVTAPIRALLPGVRR